MTYTGRLLTPVEGEELETELPACDGRMMHAHAKSSAIADIVLGRTVTLTRRRFTAGFDDGPGEVHGEVIGMSTDHEGRIVLGLWDGEQTLGVDVTNPREWTWQVH